MGRHAGSSAAAPCLLLCCPCSHPCTFASVMRSLTSTPSHLITVTLLRWQGGPISVLQTDEMMLLGQS